MTIENQQDQQDQQDQTNQHADAAMMAGFNKVRGDEPPAEDPPKKEESQAEQTQPEASTDKVDAEPNTEAATAKVEDKEEAKTEKAPEPAAEDDPIVPGVGLKASEVKALLAKAAQFDQIKETVEANNRKVFGRFGELQSELKKLHERPAGQPAKVTAEALKRLQKEYPEMASMLAEDLSDVLQAPAGTFTKDQVDEIVSGKVAEKSAEVEVKLLTIAHPDWREHRKAPEFDIWLSTLPTDVAHEVRSSQDAMFLAEAFRAHKAWKNAAIEAKKSADAAAASAAAAKQKTEKRLEGAITPTGVTPPTPPSPTAESAMQAGFKRARGR